MKTRQYQVLFIGAPMFSRFEFATLICACLYPILLFTIAAAASHAAVSSCELGTQYVAVDALNVRSQPIDGDVVNRVRKGDQVEVFECRGPWARIASTRWVHSGYLSAGRPSAAVRSQSSTKAARFRELRDDAIRMLGWVAGNSAAHPVWPQVKPYVGRGGQYYDFLVRLSPPDLDRNAQSAEAFHNVSLYQEWVEKGRTRPFNEPDNIRKLKRIIQISEEVIGICR